MTNEEKKKLYAALSAPFTDEAIERTEGRITGKGYDTTGIKYIYIAARLNTVLGVGGYRTQQEIAVREITTSKGRAAFDATCDLTLQLGEWVDGKFVAFAEAYAAGGHQSMNEADARKGAYTNAFKKAAAMFGCGQQAYMGTLDDDNVPAEEPAQFSAPVRPQPAPRPQPAQPRPVQQARPEPVRQPPPQRYEHTGPEETLAQAAPPQGAASNGRNRLTSKQLAAIWALARKLGYQQSDFRREVKQKWGVQPEFLGKNEASTIIGQLSAMASNGSGHPTSHTEA